MKYELADQYKTIIIWILKEMKREEGFNISDELIEPIAEEMSDSETFHQDSFYYMKHLIKKETEFWLEELNKEE